MAENTVPPSAPPPHDADRPLGTPPPVAPPPRAGGPPWGKIALFGCLGLLVLGILLGVVGFFMYRHLRDRGTDLTERYIEERQGGILPGDEDAEGGRVIEGTLDANDRVRDDGSYYEEHAVNVPAGSRLVVTLQSTDFDAYLTVHSPSNDIESDDDGGGGTDARVEIPSTEAGTYRIWANTLLSGATGEYELRIEQAP